MIPLEDRIDVDGCYGSVDLFGSSILTSKMELLGPAQIQTQSIRKAINFLLSIFFVVKTLTSRPADPEIREPPQSCSQYEFEPFN